MEKGKYNILNFKLYYIIQGKIERKNKTNIRYKTISYMHGYFNNSYNSLCSRIDNFKI